MKNPPSPPRPKAAPWLRPVPQPCPGAEPTPRWHLLGLLFTLLLALAGCGGGGGGGTSGGGSTFGVNGRVIWIGTGGPPNPSATIQSGSASTTTNPADGSFSLDAPSGATELTVLFQPDAGDPVAFRFAFPASTEDIDVGDLFIGPSKVNVVGRVVDSNGTAPIAGARVTLAGRSATTATDGTFTLVDVAYDPDAISAFGALEGRAFASGYFPRAFSPIEVPSGGVSSVGDVFLTADSGSDPPPLPQTIFGTVGPANLAPGTVVELLTGAIVVRRMTVNVSGEYGFWVPPGTYTVRFQNPTNGTSAPDQAATLATLTDTARRDATLQ